jgi:hypothetical protein
VSVGGLGVIEGISVGVNGLEVNVEVTGGGVSVTEGTICMNGRIKQKQDAAGKRINIIIKRRRMDIL